MLHSSRKGRPRKNPKNVAYGEHLRGTHARSSHVGYDCYRTGPINDDSGRIRVVLRPNRIPQGVPDKIRLLLPQEMSWPQPDHVQAHGMIDAVVTLDTGNMRSWQDAWPSHTFGFESFLTWALKFKEAQSIRDPDRPAPVSVEHGQTIVRGAYFPSQVVAVAKVGDIPHEGYEIRVALVTFNDESTALRISLYGTFASGGSIRLSRAYVDPLNNHFEIVEHHPGRYQALGLPTSLIYAVLGTKKRENSTPIRPRDRTAHDPRAPQRFDPPPPPEGAPAPDIFDNSNAGNAKKEQRTRRLLRTATAVVGDDEPDGGTDQGTDLSVFPPPPKSLP